MFLCQQSSFTEVHRWEFFASAGLSFIFTANAIKNANLTPIKAQKLSSSHFENPLLVREEILINVAAIFPGLKNGAADTVSEGSHTSLKTR